MLNKNLLNELREITGAGMMDCNKAIAEANGDKEQAILILRKKGMASAQQKASREAGVKCIFLANTENSFSLLELNSETDFVAKSDRFQKFGYSVASLALQVKDGSLESFFSKTLPSGESVENFFNAEKSAFGENIVAKRLETVILESNQRATFYLHNKMSDNGAQIVSVIVHEGESSACLDFAKQIAMHIAASSPLYLSPEEIPANIKEREMNLYREKIEQSGKTGDIATKIAEGMFNKFAEESTLLKQMFVMDNKKRIEEAVASFNKEKGENFKIINFYRFA